jgi:uncharacterized protein YcbK (DUF882 family)
MSKNWFIPEEFECQCKNKRCVGKEPQMRMNPLLLQALNRVREEFKKPIIVTSGFRCPDHNKAIGGAIKSQHLQGTAADIRPASGKKEDLEELYQLCKKELGFTGLGDGRPKNFVHVDVRQKNPKEKRSEWIY